MKRKTTRPLVFNLMIYKTSNTCHYYDYPTFTEMTIKNNLKHKCFFGSYMPTRNIRLQVTENKAFCLSKFGGLIGFIQSIVYSIIILILSFIAIYKLFANDLVINHENDEQTIKAHDFVFLFVQWININIFNKRPKQLKIDWLSKLIKFCFKIKPIKISF